MNVTAIRHATVVVLGILAGTGALAAGSWALGTMAAAHPCLAGAVAFGLVVAALWVVAYRDEARRLQQMEDELR